MSIENMDRGRIEPTTTSSFPHGLVSIIHKVVPKFAPLAIIITL